MSRPSETSCAPSVALPREWLAPRRWPGVSALGPWSNDEGTLPYPAEEMKRSLPGAVWDLEVREKDLPIPEGLRRMLAWWRPTPIREAHGIRKALGLRTRILFKDESACPVFSYKANGALAQAWFAAQEGIKGLVAYTLSGYWGVGLAWACAKMGLACKVMVPQPLSSERPTLLREVLKWNATLHEVNAHPTSEALENDGWRFAVGCFLNSVVSYNTLIGQEALDQLARMDVKPQVLVGACGGGTNFGGFILPFLLNSDAGPPAGPRLFAVEPARASKFNRGVLKPVRVFGPGGPVYHTFTVREDLPSAGKSGERPWAPGLTYPTATPLLVALSSQGRLESYACAEGQAQSAAQLFAANEGIKPAPEAAYAVWGAIEAAKMLDTAGPPGVVLFCLSGGQRIEP